MPSIPRALRGFEYFGLRTLYDRYLLKHPTLRQVVENAAILLDARGGGVERHRARRD